MRSVQHTSDEPQAPVIYGYLVLDVFIVYYDRNQYRRLYRLPRFDDAFEWTRFDLSGIRDSDSHTT